MYMCCFARRRNNLLNCIRMINQGIAICRQGICEISQALNGEVRNNNICRGMRGICAGACIAQQGLDCIRAAVRRCGLQSGWVCSGLRRCSQALSDINFGACQLDCNNVSDGIGYVDCGIAKFEEGLNAIKGALANSVVSCANV